MTDARTAHWLGRFTALLLLAFATAAPAAAQDMSTDGAMGDMTIAEYLTNNDEYSTLAMLLQRAGLMETLQDDGARFTMFAPTNAAFARMPDGVREELLEPENIRRLQNVLKFHLVPASATSMGDVLSTDDLQKLADQEQIPTAYGSPIYLSDAQAGLMVNNAVVIDQNNDTANGMVHAVDLVLLPHNETWW